MLTLLIAITIVLASLLLYIIFTPTTSSRSTSSNTTRSLWSSVRHKFLNINFLYYYFTALRKHHVQATPATELELQDSENHKNLIDAEASGSDTDSSSYYYYTSESDNAEEDIVGNTNEDKSVEGEEDTDCINNLTFYFIKRVLPLAMERYDSFNANSGSDRNRKQRKHRLKLKRTKSSKHSKLRVQNKNKDKNKDTIDTTSMMMMPSAIIQLNDRPAIEFTDNEHHFKIPTPAAAASTTTNNTNMYSLLSHHSSSISTMAQSVGKILVTSKPQSEDNSTNSSYSYTSSIFSWIKSKLYLGTNDTSTRPLSSSSYKQCGTGWIIAKYNTSDSNNKYIIVTNCHVVQEFATIYTDQRCEMNSSTETIISFSFNGNSNTSNLMYKIIQVLYCSVDADLDYALCIIEEPSTVSGSSNRTLQPIKCKILESSTSTTTNSTIAAIGYPCVDSTLAKQEEQSKDNKKSSTSSNNTNDELVEHRLAFEKYFNNGNTSDLNVKRVSPGKILPKYNDTVHHPNGDNTGDNTLFLFHDCSTLAGSSGSVIVQLPQVPSPPPLQVVPPSSSLPSLSSTIRDNSVPRAIAIHMGGKYKDHNTALLLEPIITLIHDKKWGTVDTQ